MHGCLAPVVQQAEATGQTRHARGGRHLWISRGLGNPGLLLALVLDREDGHPDNATATGRILGVARATIRTWRTELIAAGWSSRSAVTWWARPSAASCGTRLTRCRVR